VAIARLGREPYRTSELQVDEATKEEKKSLGFDAGGFIAKAE
jgi:hypothetical protein